MFDTAQKSKTKSAKLPLYTKNCLNLYHSGGKTKARYGLVENYRDDITAKENADDILIIDQRSPVEINGEMCKIYTMLYYTDDGYINMRVKAYSRTKVYYFIMPVYEKSLGKENVRCLFFNGTPNKGCGLYMLAGVVADNKVKLQFVAELNHDFNSFIVNDENDFFAPVVLEHGRGNSFYKAPEEVRNSLKEPKNFQPFNVLLGKFIAKYRTDGVSSKFFLPTSPIVTYDVVVTFRGCNGETYTYEIPNGKGQSTAQDVMYVTYDIETGNAITQTKSVNVFVDYNSGAISTTTALPFVDGLEDNLTVVAFASFDNSMKLFECKEVFTVDSDTNGGKSVVFLNSNDNQMYFSSPNDLFYFPKCNVAEFDCDFSKGYAIVHCAGNVFMQMGVHIYAIKGVNTRRSGDETLSNSLNIIKTQGIVKDDCSRSLRAVGDRVYFLSNDGYICSMSGNGNGYFDLKRESNERFLDTHSVWSWEYDGKYILCIGNCAYFADGSLAPFNFDGLDYSIISVSPDNLLIKYQDTKMISMTLDGLKDESLTSDGVIQQININAVYNLFNEDFGSFERKNFYKVRLCFEADNPPDERVTFTVRDEHGGEIMRQVYINSTGTTIKDVYFNLRCRAVSITMSFCGGISFTDGEIYYTN